MLERLTKKLDVSKAHVYTLIQQISAKNRVPRHLGALLLAGDNHISVQKYASTQDLAELRGIPNHISVATPTAASIVPRAVARKNVKAANLPKTKENTVFVVHGRDANLRDAIY